MFFTLSPDLKSAGVHLLSAVAAIAFLAYKAHIGAGRRMSEAGFARRGISGETLIGVVIGAALISSVIGILSLLGFYHAQGVNRQFHFLLPLLACLFIGIFEEAIFRGYVFRVAEYRYGSLIALVISSIIFGLLHILNVASAPIPFYQKLAGPAFISLEAGLLLGAAYMATRRLWLPIGIHWAWNFFEGPIYGADVSGNAAQRNMLLHSSLRGPFLLTGGTFGPEGSLICAAVGLVFGGAVLWVAVRKGEWKARTRLKTLSQVKSEHDY